MTSLPRLPLDHIVYAAPNLEQAVAELADRLGVVASPGGAHPGLGTRNALLALGNECYIEVIAPDPEQPTPPRARPFGIDELSGPRVVTWAARASRLDEQVASARAAGFDPGTPIPVRRTTPAGETISWRLCFPSKPTGDGLVPFLIAWGQADHPSSHAASGCALHSLRAEHPDPAAIRRVLEALGTDLELSQGSAPRLIALLDTPKGQLELR
jgi:hypothetical protein